MAHDINYTTAFNMPKAMSLPDGRVREKEEKLEAACLCSLCEKQRLRDPAVWGAAVGKLLLERFFM